MNMLLLITCAAAFALLSIRTSPDIVKSARFNTIGEVLGLAAMRIMRALGEDGTLSSGIAWAAMMLAVETIIMATWFLLTQRSDD